MQREKKRHGRVWKNGYLHKMSKESDQKSSVSDAPMALLNHVMKRAYCYPKSEKFCLEGSKLHKASNPSVDTKLVRVKNER